MTTEKLKIGFVGTGHMGQPMASNLIKAGYELTVYDKREEATEALVREGAQRADSPKAVARASKVTISILPGPPEIEEAALGADGILEGAHEGDFYIDMSTSTPSRIREIAKIAANKGVEVLDAPVSGGVRGARLATLAIMVGGKPSAFDFCEPILKKLGERIFYIGEVGAGCVAKLVNNMMGISNTLAAMEAMVIGTKAGVNPQKLLEVANAGTGASFMLNNTFTYIVLKGKFEPTRFAMSLAAKDFRLAVDYAEEIGVPVRVVKCVADSLDEALKQGLAEKDMTSYITLLEKATGIEVRA